MKLKKNSIGKIQRIAFAILIFSALTTFLLPKGSPELFINRYHHPLFDLFFGTWTHFGDAIILLVILPLLAVRKVSYAVFMSLAVMVQMILILIFKHGLFKGMPRPAEYLKGISFYQVPGIELHHWNSFPSGHTATAMVIAAGFMIIFKRNRQIQWLALTAGLVVAFSRVYLMQHFFVDIFAGAALGMISAWIARSLYFRWFPNYKFNRSILVYFGYGKRKEGTVPIKNPGISA